MRCEAPTRRIADESRSWSEPMSSQRLSPKTDDFRLEREGDGLVLTFTPDGRSYAFDVKDGHLSEPAVSPPRVEAADYAEDDIRKAATELARLALTGSPGSE
jgi:hypothetical protein